MPIGAALKAFHKSRFAEVKSGKFVVNTSANGNSVQFYVAPQGGALQPEVITTLSQEFREVYASALSALDTAGTAYDAQDAAYNSVILAAMLDDDRLHGANSFSCDFGGLRCV